MTVVLSAKDIVVDFDGYLALDRVSIEVAKGESFGLVGESGSGKSTLLRAIAGLNHFEEGALMVDGRTYSRKSRDKSFYRDVQMVFQDPYGSLHPRQTVDAILLEPLVIHGVDNTEARIARGRQFNVERSVDRYLGLLSATGLRVSTPPHLIEQQAEPAAP